MEDQGVFMKSLYGLLAILAMPGFANVGLCKEQTKWPVAELKGCMLEDLFYAKITVDDPRLRETRAQLKDGGVVILVPAAFAENWGTSEDEVKQSEIFKNLPVQYPNDFYIIDSLDKLQHLTSGRIGLIGAIENGGSLFSDKKSFEEGVKSFEKVLANTGRILYVSLSWKRETPLGGGDTTTIGLKEYGKKFLDYLSDKNKKGTYKIAIDVSHASDALSKDIFDYIDKHSLDLKVIASHSSLRAIKDIPRNVPDWVVKEIIKRGGVVGLNFINIYIGDKPDDFLKHFDYLINNLGGEKSVVFGADWFKDDRTDIPMSIVQGHKVDNSSYFFQRYNNASTYQVLLNDLRKKMKFTNDRLEDIASKNFINFVSKQWGG